MSADLSTEKRGDTVVNPLRVAVLFEYPTLNGGEHSMLAALGVLSERTDLRVTAIAPPGGRLTEALQDRKISVDEWSVRQADGRRKDRLVQFRELSDLLTRRQIEVLHANSLSMARLTGAYAIAADTEPAFRQVACTGHLRDIMKLKLGVIRDLNGNRGLAAVADAVRSYHLGQGLDAGRCEVLYNGVDLSQFAYRSGTSREGFPFLPPHAFVLLNVGQICLRKGQDDLMAAAVPLMQADSNIHLVIIGVRHSRKAESVRYEADLVRSAKAGGVADRVHWLGQRTDVAELMAAADCLVHTARQEPFGRVLLEAGATGLPIIATDVGGTQELITDQKTGLLVSAGDLPAVQAAIRAVQNDRRAASRRAGQLHAEVEQHYDHRVSAAALAEFWYRNRIHSLGDVKT